MSCHHLSQESARSEKRARFYSTCLDKDNHSLGFIQPNLIRQPFSGLPSPQNRGGQWWSSRQTPGRPDKGPALLGEGGKVFSMWEKSRQNSWRTNCDFLWNPFFSVQLLLGSRRQEVMHWCAQVVAVLKILRSTRWDLDEFDYCQGMLSRWGLARSWNRWEEWRRGMSVEN